MFIIHDFITGIAETVSFVQQDGTMLRYQYRTIELMQLCISGY